MLGTIVFHYRYTTEYQYHKPHVFYIQAMDKILPAGNTVLTHALEKEKLAFT